MIPFDPLPEPPDFDKKVRQPGNAWLAKNPDPKKGSTKARGLASFTSL